MKMLAATLLAHPEQYGMMWSKTTIKGEKKGNTLTTLYTDAPILIVGPHDTADRASNTLTKLRAAYGDECLVDLMEGASSMRVKQQNKMRPVLEKLNTIQRAKYTREDLKRLCVDAILSIRSSGATVVVDYVNLPIGRFEQSAVNADVVAALLAFYVENGLSVDVARTVTEKTLSHAGVDMSQLFGDESEEEEEEEETPVANKTTVTAAKQ